MTVLESERALKSEWYLNWVLNGIRKVKLRMKSTGREKGRKATRKEIFRVNVAATCFFTFCVTRFLQVLGKFSQDLLPKFPRPQFS